MNVSVMETNQSSRSTGFENRRSIRQMLRRRRWWFVRAALLGVLIACRPSTLSVPKDQDGNRPQDIARMFVDAVQAGDFQKAATYWRPGDVRNIEANSDRTFEAFCVEFFKCDTYQLTPMGKDKKAYVVAFRGKQDGKEKTFGLFLDQINGKFRLVMDRFMDSQ
jgi:hypothetical protein